MSQVHADGVILLGCFECPGTKELRVLMNTVVASCLDERNVSK